MRNGKLSKRELETLNKSWGILSRWTEKMEEDNDIDTLDEEQDYLYTHACYAVTGLCEFIGNYKA